mmetsp:Transcript_172869/g.554255  ORF Transcript_172869/g.554255 Transcript_172869/m.554255 type:complete len:144 (+) Transcript_172869:274-705(+)
MPLVVSTAPRRSCCLIPDAVANELPLVAGDGTGSGGGGGAAADVLAPVPSEGGTLPPMPNGSCVEDALPPLGWSDVLPPLSVCGSVYAEEWLPPLGAGGGGGDLALTPISPWQTLEEWPPQGGGLPSVPRPPSDPPPALGGSS